MGSFSQFIVQADVKEHLDEAFSRALQSEQWNDYFDDCHFYLLKASQESVSTSLSGATKLLQYYNNKIISTSNDDSLVVKCIDIFQQIIDLCKIARTSDNQSWYDEVAASSLVADMYQPCLLHWQKDVRIFAGQQVNELLEHKGAQIILGCPEMIMSTIKLLDKGLAKDSSEAKNILVTLSKSAEGLTALFSESQHQEAFKKVAAVSDMARFNVYEVMQRIAICSTENLSEVSNSGWLDQLISEASSQDVLNRLAALQLLTEMMEDDRTLLHLCKAEVMSNLENDLVNAKNEDDCNTAMTLPGLLKLFGELGNKHPEILMHQFGSALGAIFHLSASTDNTMMTIAVDTLAHVARSSQSKLMLQSFHKEEMHKVLETVQRRLQNAPVEIRNRLLEATTVFFKCSDSPDRIEKDEISEILHDWYVALCPCKTIAPIFRMLKLPFSDFRPYVYRMLLELVKTSWGVKLILSCEPLCTFLIDRTNEGEKLGKELKFELISQLYESKELIIEARGSKMMEKIKEYHMCGPYFVAPYNEDMENVFNIR